MFKRMMYLSSVAVVLSMAMKVSATDWANTSGDGKWSTAANWSLGAVPVVVADATGMAAINLSGSNACVIDGTQPQAVCQWLFVADAYASGTLNVVSGGKIGNPIWGPGETHIANTASEACIGVINVDGAGSIAQSECWRIGSTEKSSGTLNITNGGHVVAGMWPQSMHIFATGRVNIISGSMYISGGAPDTGGSGSALTIDNGGVMNIYGTCTLTLHGDQSTLVNGFIASGKITGPKSSRCPLLVSYDDYYELTTVSVVGCTCTTYSAGDFNHDCYVDFSDFAVFANNWLSCTDPLDSNCL